MAGRVSFIGPAQRVGLIAAGAVAASDQAVKAWLLFGFDMEERGRVALTPFLDLVLAWNTGISFGMFQQAGPFGQWALFALKAIAVVLLGLWLVRTGSRLSGLALGLIIGGAIGNAIDRVVHGAVMDYVLFHVAATGWTFQWSVFNLADAAIVGGVIGLLYESLFAGAPQKRPDVYQ
jgi:signal peptidase II